MPLAIWFVESRLVVRWTLMPVLDWNGARTSRNALSSAYRTEGGNGNTDWWWWEHIAATPCSEPSGDACDFYHRYREDIAMLAGFGLNCFRFGIEWARIEPAEGEFSRAALAHYRLILDACHEHGISPLVTFDHFTVPKWLHDQGGIASERFP